jgi:hypothetical protein
MPPLGAFFRSRRNLCCPNLKGYGLLTLCRELGNAVESIASLFPHKPGSATWYEASAAIAVVAYS